MGAFSNLGLFSDSQEITADDTPSTSTLDLAQALSLIGAGRSPFLCIRTAVAPTEVADTLSIELQSDADDGAGSPAGTWTHVVMMPLVGVNGAEVIASDSRLALAGAWIYRGRLPHEILERHIRLMYRNTTSNGTFTISAWLEDEAPSDRNQVAVSNVGQP